jgi:hypothetical protein
MAKSKPTRRGGAATRRRTARPARTRPKAAAKAAKGTKARRTGAARKAAGRSAKARKAAKARPRPAAKAARPAKKPASRATAPKTKTPARKATPAPPRAVAKKAAAAKRATHPGRAPTLDRERRRATDPEMVPTPPSSLDLDRSASAARSGRAEFAHKLAEHTSTSPAMTGGDLDADWEAAESIGDEAPGGDNPTPDQDVVDEIGRSLGVEYDDDEELQGGDEISARDKKRWELDPASSDDFDERDE